jgi:hypothetical protein
MRPRFLLRLLLALLGLQSVAFAQAPDVPDEDLRVSLVTFSPGPLYWERFGHNALLLRDASSGEALLFNYGIFDFQQKNFFLNFALGRMQYRLAIQPLEQALPWYADEGRWAYEQELALSPAQHKAMALFLFWNARPQNAEYRYDYFLANCSTRVRDALDTAVHGALRAATEQQPAGSSFRREATRLIGPVLPLAVAMDLALGPAADRPISVWEQSFVPMSLRDAVREVQLPAAGGGTRPLLSAERWLLRAPAGDGPTAPPRLWPAQLGFGLALGLGLALLGVLRPRQAWARRLLALAAPLLMSLIGLLGLLLLILWTLTEHRAGWANRNLLLLNPLCLLLVPTWWRSLRRDWQPEPGAWQLTLLIGAGALVSPLLLLLPGAQQNQGWIALLLPLHLALALALRRASARAG